MTEPTAPKGAYRAPVRICCGKPHVGPVCPDGKVMCALCFDRVTASEAWRDRNGQAWDLCVSCGDKDGGGATASSDEQEMTP